MTAAAGTPPNSTPTPIGSINSTPQLALTNASGAGYNNAGYNPGNNDYTAGAGADAGKVRDVPSPVQR